METLAELSITPPSTAGLWDQALKCRQQAFNNRPITFGQLKQSQGADFGDIPGFPQLPDVNDLGRIAPKPVKNSRVQNASLS
jgi:hypothetical protein